MEDRCADQQSLAVTLSCSRASVGVPLALLALTAASLEMLACGGKTAHKATAARSRAVSSSVNTAAATRRALAPSSGASSNDFTKIDRDKDNDNSSYDDANNEETLNFGRAAEAPDKRAVTALVKRYYRAALARDGASACTMLYSTLAESAPEDYGEYGASYLKGAKSCPAVLDKTFEFFHRQIAAESASLQVARVRLKERHGIAVLRFRKLPEREIAVKQEGHGWRIDALLDGELP